MNIEIFTLKWFFIFYLVTGTLVFILGIIQIVNPPVVEKYLVGKTRNENPPAVMVKFLKYFFLFTIINLVLSFFPFSIAELLFSIWSLGMVYIIGIQLVRWEQTRRLIREYRSNLQIYTRYTGAIMVAVGCVIFMLIYHLLNRGSL